MSVADAPSAVPAVHQTAAPPVRARLWHRAPGWAFTAVSAVGAAGLLWSVSMPYGALLPAIVAFWVLVICAAIWLLRLVTFGYRRSARPRQRAWPFLVAPIGGLLVGGLLAAGVPLDARWAASRAAFDDQADALAAEAGPGEPGVTLVQDERLGLYRVGEAFVDADGNVFFSITGSGFIGTGGFARFSGGPPDDVGGDRFQHLGGDWYEWYDDF